MEVNQNCMAPAVIEFRQQSNNYLNVHAFSFGLRVVLNSLKYDYKRILIRMNDYIIILIRMNNYIKNTNEDGL